MHDEWRNLCQTVHDMAEGYAATDPANAWLYRDEANMFCEADVPADDHEFALRQALATTLRRRWSDRIAQRGKP